MAAKTRVAMGPASSIRARVPAVTAPVTHEAGAAVRRRDRAHRRASWAAARTPSRVLAEHFGVSESRARHYRTDDQAGPVTTLCDMIADPAVDGAAILAAAIEAFEERFVYAPTEELKARLKHLREVIEHRAQAEQDRAVMVRDRCRAEACRNHAAVLLEMAVLEELLGIEEVH